MKQTTGDQAGIFDTETLFRRGFIGRNREMSRLGTLYHEAAAGHLRAVAIEAEAGIGKSRLVDEFALGLRRIRHFRVQLQCSPYHAESPLWPFHRYLLRASRIAATDEPAIKVEKLRQLLDVPDIDLERALASLSDFLGFSGDGVADLSAALRRRRVFDTLIAYLGALALKRPLLLIVEDTHWIDPSSVDLLAQLVGDGRTWPVLLLMTCRPEGRAAIQGIGGLEEIALSGLDRDSAERIVGRITEGSVISDDTVSALITRSGGNPLMVEELTRATVASGGARVPESLSESLAPHLDKLPALRSILQHAACIGREFEADLLAGAIGANEQSLGESLRRLETEGLIFRRGPVSEQIFGFKHALLRDAVHDGLSDRERRVIHGRIADRLEARGDAVPRELVAEHALAAGRFLVAVDLWTEAGDRAASRGAIVEASHHYRAAIGALARTDIGEDDRRAREIGLQLALGGVLIGVKGYGAPETGEAFLRAERLGRDAEDQGQRLRALYGVYGYFQLTARIDEAHQISAELLDLAEKEASPRALIVGHRTRGLTHSYRGGHRDAERHLTAVLDLYEHHGEGLAFELSNDPKTTALCFLGITRFALGRPDQALSDWREAVSHARALQHNPSLCYALDFWCTAQVLSRQTERIRPQADLLSKCAEEQGLEYWVALGGIWRAWDEAMVRRKASGVDDLRAAVTHLESIGGALVIPFFLSLVSEAEAAHGDHAMARATIEDAVHRACSSGERWFLPELFRLDARFAASGNTDSIEARLREATALAEAQGAAMWTLRAARDLAGLLRDQRRDREALALLGPVLSQFNEGFGLPDLTEARAAVDALSATA